MRICIIDDDPICHFIAKKMIGKMFPQCELSHFYDGKKAIEFFEEKQFAISDLPELVLLDINMPVMDGWDFISMLEQLDIPCYDPSIFICSSSVSPVDVNRAKIIHAVQGYLTKPLNISALKDAFTSVVSKAVC